MSPSSALAPTPPLHRCSSAGGIPPAGGQYELAALRPAEDVACSPAVAAAERMVEKAQAQALAAFTELGLASLTDSRREGLQHSADRAAVALESAREELATVTRATHDASGASPHAIMDQFQTAIGALVKPGGKVSQLEAAALEKVFCDLSLRPVNAGQWAGRCFMRLPLADGSVLRCGPLVWDVTVPFAADSRRVALALGADGNFPWERQRARVRLEEAGLQRQQARMISDCAFRWLHPVVMHVVADTPLPEGIPQDWTQPQFMSWAARAGMYFRPNQDDFHECRFRTTLGVSDAGHTRRHPPWPRADA